MSYRISSWTAAHAAEASALILESFARFNAGQYDDPTRFTRTVTPAAIEALCAKEIALGAFEEEVLIGVAALQGEDHLELLFVSERNHRRGIARALWIGLLDVLRAKGRAPHKITVNASDYAVPAYERLGFARVGGVMGSHGREINRMIWRAP